jgi:2,3-bisphosphoglycerate-independent phosphoglycerate mutase
VKRDVLPLVLIVLDGWGEAPSSDRNAISSAPPDQVNLLRAAYPTTLLAAYLSLGAGRIVLQDLPRINRAIETGELSRNRQIAGAMDAALSQDRSLHFMGLFSPGGVHSHIEHLRALIDMARGRGAQKILIHAFLDGRDVSPRSALPLMREFEAEQERSGGARVATVQGRFYGMDRDNRWERIERGWRALVRGEGMRVNSGAQAIEQAYERGETDEFVQPSVVESGDGQPIGPIVDGDAVIHFNFRADRARELTRALALEDCPQFERVVRPVLSFYLCFTEYDRTFGLPIAFPNLPPTRVFGEVISALGLRQARLAETEKYAHVTYFFNGGREQVFEREERLLVPSTRKVATYDLQPEMSAAELTRRIMERIRGGADDFMLVNFANPDMVGHTGVYDAAVLACRTVDACVGRIVREVTARGGCAVVTSDHGNCEQMVDPATGSPHTAHTTNPVPFVLACEKLRGRRLRSGGQLADVAPTLLDLLDVRRPDEMDGHSLLDG